MSLSSAAREIEDIGVSPSPFRAAFDRARIEAYAAPGPSHEPLADVRLRPTFEYRLVRRSGKRSADEVDWNTLGRNGWELVGVTRKHAAFKRLL